MPFQKMFMILLTHLQGTEYARLALFLRCEACKCLCYVVLVKGFTLCSYADSAWKVHKAALIIVVGILLFVFCWMMRSVANRLDVRRLIELCEKADQGI